MANWMNQITGKKSNTASTLPPGSKGTLLELFLSSMPFETQVQQKVRFAPVLMNFEFGLFVPKETIELHVDQADKKGFTVWANVDPTSAFLYGAGFIQKDDFTRHMEWLRTIACPAGKITAAIHNPGEPMQLIEITV